MNIYFRKTLTVSNLILAIAVLMFVVSCKSKPKTKRDTESNRGMSEIERKLGIRLPESANKAYFDEVARWIGTPYRYGGSDQRGTDCSGFVMVVYQRVFQIKLDHQSGKQKEKSKPVQANRLKEGDLYFFKPDGKKVSHVGMHLVDDFFVHASTKKGVVVSKLSEPYYANSFDGFGTYR